MEMVKVAEFHPRNERTFQYYIVNTMTVEDISKGPFH